MSASFSWRWRRTNALNASISAVCAAIQAAVKASSAAAFVSRRSSGVAKIGVVDTRGACGVQANSFTSVCVTRGVSAASKKSSTLSLPPSDTLGAGVRLGFACCGAAFFSMFVTSVRARRRLALGVAVVAIAAFLSPAACAGGGAVKARFRASARGGGVRQRSRRRALSLARGYSLSVRALCETGGRQ